MKKLLFDILNKIEPYELVRININNEELYVCREDACLPLAIRAIDYEPEMENGNYFYSQDVNELHRYIKSHKFSIEDYDYIIENELSYIKYYDDYIHITISSIGGEYKYFIPYSSITCICIMHSHSMSRCSSSNVIEYNKIQYELIRGN